MLSRQKVLYTPELLAEILSHLDMRTLLLSQRVSKRWRQTISGTPSLQRALFFRPAAAAPPSAAALVRDRELNPLLREAFPPFFRANETNDEGTVNKLDVLMVRADSRPLSFMDDAAAAPELRRSGLQAAFLRAGASWRRMLVQQPAAPKLGFIDEVGLYEKSYSNACFSFEEQERQQPGSGGGVRMGALYDLVYQFVGSRSPVGREDRFAFGVYWREPERDPPVNQWSAKYGGKDLALKDLGDDVVVVVMRRADAEDENLGRVTQKTALRGEYLPEEWEGREVALKLISSQDWFG